MKKAPSGAFFVAGKKIRQKFAYTGKSGILYIRDEEEESSRYIRRIRRRKNSFLCLNAAAACSGICVFLDSIYYMMRCLPVVYTVDYIRGMLIMCHKETKKILNANDLLTLMETDLDEDALKKCTEEFNANGLPKYEEKDEPETEAKEPEQKEYGWLSPEGDFHSAEWGCHEMAAQWLCRELGIDSGYRMCRDILVERGWCLIDDPYDSGQYFVTHKKDLTKKQKDFLYGYFLDMGMKKRAEEFVRDDT